MKSIQQRLIFSIILIFLGCTSSERIRVEQAESLLDEGLAFMKQRKLEQAIQAFEQTDLLTSVYHYEAKNYIGLIYLEKNEFQKAERAFLESIEHRDNFPESRNNLGYLYLQTQRFDKAEEQFVIALQIYPEYAMARKNMNLLSRLQKNELTLNTLELFKSTHRSDELEKKMAGYKEILEKNPDFKEAKNNLAVTYFYIGELDSAKTLLNELLEKHPNFYEVHNNLAYLYFGNKNYKLAIKHYLEAVKIQPTYMVALDNLGDVYYEIKSFSNAKRIWETILELEPLNHSVREKLKNLSSD